jgi:hypothetical protein
VLPIFFRHSNYTSFVRQVPHPHPAQHVRLPQDPPGEPRKRLQEHHVQARIQVPPPPSRHLLKDIQRKDYKKNKENTKETATHEKSIVERSKENNKNERNYEAITDSNQLALNKVKELNADLERKAIFIASLREMPEEELDVIRLLDVLFDARKLQREMLEKLSSLESSSVEGRRQNRTLSLKLELFPEKESPKQECPTA